MKIAMDVKRLLLVDDNLIARIGLMASLEKMNVVIDEAENGKSAIKTFSQTGVNYDVVLMDYNMPDLNGAAVAVELRKIEDQSNKKKSLIIGVTNYLDPKVKAMCIKSGMNTVIGKPLDVNKFIKIVHELDNQFFGEV